jgi:PAS domain S-box-containing protein
MSFEPSAIDGDPSMMHELATPLSLLAEDPTHLDSQGRIVYLKPAIEHQRKYPSQKALEKLWRDFVPQLSEHRLAEFNTAMRARHPLAPNSPGFKRPSLSPTQADPLLVRTQPAADSTRALAADTRPARRRLAPRYDPMRSCDREELKLLRSERDRALAALNSVTDAIICVDTGKAITQLNRRAELLTGWSTEQAQGRPLSEVLHGLDAATQAQLCHPPLLAEFHNHPRDLRIGCALIARDGGLTPVEASTSAICDSNGHLIGAALAFRNDKRLDPLSPREALSGIPNQALPLERLLEQQLLEAIETQSFVLHYQPQVNLHTGAMVGVEALIRWQHPSRGLLSPAQFMSVAEECGLIVPIGRWALKQACRQARTWRLAGLTPLIMSVNVSTVELNSPGFVEGVRDALMSTGFPPQFLELEVTETFLAPNPEGIGSVLTALSKLGIKIVLDDFGTGYSSLSFLKRYPVNTLKIDQSFIQDLTSDKGSSSIVRALISLGKNLDLRVVAEAVETPAQLSWLRHHDCAEAQGYFFCPPVPPEELTRLLRDGRPLCEKPLRVA